MTRRSSPVAHEASRRKSQVREDRRAAADIIHRGGSRRVTLPMLIVNNRSQQATPTVHQAPSPPRLAALASLLLALFLVAPAAARLPSLDRARTPEGHIAVLGADRELYLEALPETGEDLTRFARRLCGTAAVAGDLARLNGRSEMHPSKAVRVPLQLLRVEHQVSVIQALFPEDRVRNGYWEHWVENGSRRGVETLWRVAHWLTGDGENAGLLQELNGLDRQHLMRGQIVRIPASMLWPSLKAENGIALADSGEPALEYRYDGTGLHAIYNLRPGEPFEAAVRRLTGDSEPQTEEEIRTEIASLNGVVDPETLTAGYEIKIPAERLKPELRAPELWLPIPETQRRPVGALGFSHVSTRDYLMGLGLAAPHDAANLEALMNESASVPAAATSPSPHPTPTTPEPVPNPGRARLRQAEDVEPSRRFPDLEELPYSLWVDGRRLSKAVVHRHRDTGVLLLPFAPIAKSLGHRFNLDAGRKRLMVDRAPDGASLSLNLATGLVIANRLAAGVAPDIRLAEIDPLLLPVAATEAMTGGHVRRDDERREIHLELDARLKPIFGFELRVEGDPLLLLDPEPRAVGSVLLLPLKPIAEALGNRVTYDRARQRISVLRAQDNATIVLELATGVVRVNDWAAGVVPDMAFADLEDLLLPHPAIEALTGTHVRVEAGRRTIRVDLDAQLRDLLAPRGELLAEAAGEGFVPERLEMRLGNDMPNEIRFKGRAGRYNFQVRYETPGFPQSGALSPLWAELRFDSLGGTSGILGDYAASYRELRGVDVSRVRGLALRQQGEEGEFRFVVGQPQRGSRLLADDLSVPEFDDWVIGARYYSGGGRWEAGLAGLEMDDERKVVGSFLHRYEAPDGRLGNLRSQQEVDLGFFQTDGLSDELDLRALWTASVRPRPDFTIAAQARYMGLQFNRTRPRFEDEVLPPIEERDPDDIPPDDADRFETRLQVTWQPDPRLALGARVQLREDAFLQGEEEAAGSSFVYGVNLATQPWNRGPRLRVDYSLTDPEGAFGDEQERQLRFDLTQELGRFRLFARHEEEDGGADRSLTSLSLRMKPFTLELAKGATLLLSPGLRAFKGDGIERSDIDLRAELRSGQLFGRRFEVAIGYARSMGLNSLEPPENVTPATTRDQDPNRDQETLHATARYQLARDIALEASYINDLTRDDERLLVRLRAGIDFNPERRYRLPNEGTGVLTGFAFLDKNQDGLHQPDEPPLPGVTIWIRGRRLSLSTDRMGRFTIQNLRAGPYELEVDLDNLPLGLLPYEENLPRLTVGGGKLTHIEIPMVLSGQIRGFLFADENGNGEREPAENGLEGIQLVLDPGGATTYTTTFGQFAFDRLRAGFYTIEVADGFLPENFNPPKIEVIEISPEVELLRKINIGLLKDAGRRQEPILAGPRPP